MQNGVLGRMRPPAAPWIAQRAAAARPRLKQSIYLTKVNEMDRGITQTRSFNRVVTQRIGALRDGYLGRNRPLGESRLLFETGRDGAEVRDLRARLALDSGLVSRMLRSLERQGLLSTSTAQDDGRARFVQLTHAGRRELAKLNELSDSLAESILKTLSRAQRAKLLIAMADVERLLQASAVSCELEAPATRDARWCIKSYYDELNARFRAGFDPARSISAGLAQLTQPNGYLFVARLFHRPVGCGALKINAGGIGEIKRMWVAEDARRLGIGRRILRDLERVARGRRLKLLRLETNRTLCEAQGLYRSSGYREVKRFNDEPYAHHWFEKRIRTLRPQR
jgi:DNA-binding MarR family transcriptional regulator/GNAT superfamily N-acetyltransferase